MRVIKPNEKISKKELDTIMSLKDMEFRKNLSW